MVMKAVTTATDEGIFEAVISAETVDREKDVVSADGMVAALQKWTTTGKNIPLAWNHSPAADQQIGYVDPGSAHAVNGEVVVAGFIDQASPGRRRGVAAGEDGHARVQLRLSHRQRPPSARAAGGRSTRSTCSRSPRRRRR